MKLVNPLTQQQIDASLKFWKGWESLMVKEAKEKFPSPAEGVERKVRALRRDYSTYILEKDVVPVEGSIEHFFLQGTAATNADLVQELVDALRSATGRNEYVLASKYINLFVDSSVPILDKFAELMMGYHLDASVQCLDRRRYHRFFADINTLRQSAGLTCTVDQMDPYLWVRGEYIYEWQGAKKQVYKDLRPLFEKVDRDPASEPLLAIMLGFSVN